MSRPRLRDLASLYGYYLRATEAVAATAMGLIVAILSMQVFYRYFLSTSLVWAEEASRCLLVWICFLFAGAAFQRGEMAAIDFVRQALSPRWRALVMMPAYAVTLVLLGLITYYGIIYAGQNRIQTLPGVNALWRSLTGSTAGVSIFWVYLAIPVGTTILSLHILATMVRLLAEAFDAGRPVGSLRRP